MAKQTIDGGQVLRGTITGKVTGRKRPVHEAIFIDPSPGTFPASKIAGEVSKCWKAAKADPKTAAKALTITIRLTPRNV